MVISVYSDATLPGSLDIWWFSIAQWWVTLDTEHSSVSNCPLSHSIVDKVRSLLLSANDDKLAHTCFVSSGRSRSTHHAVDGIESAMHPFTIPYLLAWTLRASTLKVRSSVLLFPSRLSVGGVGHSYSDRTLPLRIFSGRWLEGWFCVFNIQSKPFTTMYMMVAETWEMTLPDTLHIDHSEDTRVIYLRRGCRPSVHAYDIFGEKKRDPVSSTIETLDIPRKPREKYDATAY